MPVKDIDRGYRELLARMKDASRGGSVSVGILASAASTPAGKGATLLDVATWNEFGLGVPERSFIRAYYDEALAENQAFLTRQWVLVVAGKLTPQQAFNRLGLKMVADIQKRIAARIDPPNADSTIKRKGSSVPLIDSGQLRSAIAYFVTLNAAVVAGSAGAQGGSLGGFAALGLS